MAISEGLFSRILHGLQGATGVVERMVHSPEFLDSIIENIPTMVFIKEAKELRFVRINRAACELLEVQCRDVEGKTDHDLFPADLADWYVRHDREVLDGHKVLTIPEEKLQTKSGVRFLRTVKVPIYSESGEPLFLIGISEDITELKRREADSKRLEQEREARAAAELAAGRLEFLAEASTALSTSLDLDGTLDALGKIAISRLGDWCEIILLDENDREAIERLVIANADPQKAEWGRKLRQAYRIDWSANFGTPEVIRTRRPELLAKVDNGFLDSRIPDLARREAMRSLNIHSIMILPLEYQDRALGVLSLGRSETPEPYTEFDLSIAADLARRASFAIENARLFQKAQEASKAKSAFLANMSHEIRTPLAAMLGFSELLYEGGLSPLKRKYVSTILRNGRDLLRIVDEILDLAKVESDRIAIEEVEFSLPVLLQEVLALLGVQAREKELELRARISPDLPGRMITDPSRLRQILINVIGNAIKFTRHGHVDVAIEYRPAAPESKRGVLEIRVRDTGIGISRDQREKLFQPFVQADSKTSRHFGGTGLGLSLSRRMARLLGGDVILGESDPQTGSQFVITVGVRVPQAAVPPAPSAPVQTEAPRRLNAVSSGKVLIVDDAADNRTLIHHYVARLGYTADTAKTGREAVEMALQNDYDVILMDVQMPEMDGFEAVQLLRQQDYRSPIVALTAHTMKGDRERCLESGFDDFLGKPVDRDLLRQSLERHTAHS